MSDEPRSLAGERADSPGVLVPPPVVFGAERLRAYALVYCSLATRAEKREASLTMEAVRELLTVVPFEEGEPAKSADSSGYSSFCDALWIRHQRVLGRRRDAAAMRAVGMRAYGQRRDESVNSGLNSQALLLYPGKTLDRRLYAFARSEALEKWRWNPVTVTSLSSTDRIALAKILGMNVPERVPFQGYLLLGYDQTTERGVVRLGVRSDLDDALDNPSWRSAVLGYPPGMFAPLRVPAGRLPWLNPWQGVDFAAFARDPASFERFCRALVSCVADDDGGEQAPWDTNWAEVLLIGGDSWLLGLVPYLGEVPEQQKCLQAGVDAVFDAWAAKNSLAGVIVVSDAFPREIRQSVFHTLARREPGVRPRVLVIARDGLAHLAARFPWAAVVLGSPDRPGRVREELLALARACVDHDDVDLAARALRWGLLHGHSVLSEHARRDWFHRLVLLRSNDTWTLVDELQLFLCGYPDSRGLQFWLSELVGLGFVRGPCWSGAPGWANPPGERAQESLTRLCSYLYEHNEFQSANRLVSELVKRFGQEHPVAVMATQARRVAATEHPVTNFRVGG